MLKRRPRTLIRATAAAKIFSVTPKTFVSRCRNGIYPIVVMEGPTPRSPLMVWQAQIVEVAKQKGIL